MKVCNEPGCPTLTDGERCDQHRRKAWTRHSPAPARIRGQALQERRARLFRRQPLCRICEQQGRIAPATIRDHIVPLAEGGSEHESNTQGLCANCHKDKTLQESRRGRLRASEGSPWKNATKYRRVTSGLCAECGKQPALPNQTNCADCLERKRVEAIARRQGGVLTCFEDTDS